jgi:hypothetical protein
MKKGSEWFKLLSEKEQQEFKKNCKRLEYIMGLECSFWRFIARAFDWEESPQGGEYWSDISERQL